MARAGLTPGRVVEAAAAVADDVGFDHVTLAAVADHFGVALPSLYKHIGGIEALRRELRIRGLKELAGALADAAVGKAAGAALTAMAHAYRSYAQAHPGVYAATAMAPAPGDVEHTQAATAVQRVVFAVLEGYGLAGGALVDAMRMLHAALHGFVTLEDGGSFKMARDVDASFARLVAALDVALANWG